MDILLKIAFFLEFFPKISETFVLNQITGLLELGHEVDIYARHNPKEDIIHRDVLRYKLLNNTHYFAEPLNIFNRLLKAIYFFIKYFHQEPWKLFKTLNIFKYENEVSPFKKLILTIERIILIGHLLNKNYDIIHCHFGKLSKTGIFLKKMGINTKLVTTFYGNDLTHLIKKYGINYYNDLFIYGDLFLPICKYFKEILIRLGCNESRLIIHPLGIDTKKFLSTNKKEIVPNYSINILSIGRLIEKKGFEYSIKAISKLIEVYPNINYSIVGDGPLLSILKKLIKNLGIEKNVGFLGTLERNEVIKLLKKAHIFILTSVTAKDGDKEGTPTVLLEAQAMNVPIITTFHSGIPEIILDGKTGFLVHERDVEAIKEKLELLINNPNTFRELSKHGKKYIKENFDVKMLNKRLISYYNSLLKND